MLNKDVIKCTFLFSREFSRRLMIILGKIQIIKASTEKILIFFLFFTQYKWWSIYCKWLTTIICILFCQTYLTELPILLNPLLTLSWISNNTEFCNDPVNFEITSINCTCHQQSFKKFTSIMNPELTLQHTLACHDIAKILLMLALNANQSINRYDVSKEVRNICSPVWLMWHKLS